MKSAVKKYNTAYKKKVDVDRGSFLPRRSPKGVLRCGGCGAFFYRRRWTLTIPPEIRATPTGRPIYCPACHKTKQHSASGVLSLTGIDRREVSGLLRLLRKEETRAREKNPLGRIMLVKELKGGLKLETTTGSVLI